MSTCGEQDLVDWLGKKGTMFLKIVRFWANITVIDHYTDMRFVATIATSGCVKFSLVGVKCM